MCIKLLIEEATGIVENKELKNMENRFDTLHNCHGQDGTKYFLGKFIKQFYFLSPE